MQEPIKPVEPKKPVPPTWNSTLSKDVLIDYQDGKKIVIFANSIEEQDPDGESNLQNAQPNSYPALELIRLFSSTFNVPQESIYFEAWSYDRDCYYLSLRSDVPNPNYSTELEKYNKDTEAYKVSFKKYKEELSKYREVKKVYSAHKKLEKAKMDLAKLESTV